MGTCCSGAVRIVARAPRAERLLAGAAQREAAEGGQEGVARVRQAQQPRRLRERLVALRAQHIPRIVIKAARSRHLMAQIGAA